MNHLGLRPTLCPNLLPTASDLGLTLAPRKGDAVAFYNYLDDGSAQVDRLSLHAGLPAPGEKSVAALWYHVDLAVADGQLQPLAVGVGQDAKSYRRDR